MHLLPLRNLNFENFIGANVEHDKIRPPTLVIITWEDFDGKEGGS